MCRHSRRTLTVRLSSLTIERSFSVSAPIYNHSCVDGTNTNKYFPLVKNKIVRNVKFPEDELPSLIPCLFTVPFRVDIRSEFSFTTALKHHSGIVLTKVRRTADMYKLILVVAEQERTTINQSFRSTNQNQLYKLSVTDLWTSGI